MSWLRALRPYQWAKNGLLVLAPLAAHLTPTPGLLGRLAVAIASFSALASAGYLVNDVRDREADRRHPTKRERPIAAGEVPPGGALALAAALTLASGALAWTLPPAFLVAWGGYLVGTAAYSAGLKDRIVADVLLLAALYAVRVLAGAAASSVPMSRWFLAFSVFVFTSLALTKRVAELRRKAAEAGDGAGEATGARAYRPEDEPVLTGLGTATAASAALVYCLYITGGAVAELYGRPDVLWLGLPLLLYWLGRVWIHAHRGEMAEDPLMWALTDRGSYATALAFLAVVVVAA